VYAVAVVYKYQATPEALIAQHNAFSKCVVSFLFLSEKMCSSAQQKLWLHHGHVVMHVVNVLYMTCCMPLQLNPMSTQGPLSPAQSIGPALGGCGCDPVQCCLHVAYVLHKPVSAVQTQS
jgi:hypothetical protein